MENGGRTPCPNGCGNFYRRGAGMASHLRGRRCPARVPRDDEDQDVQEVNEPVNRPPPEPARGAVNAVLPARTANRPGQGPLPTLLYMEATPGNRPRDDDDNFSVISAQIDDVEVPDILYEADYTPVRQDGRVPKVIEFVNDVIEARAPLPRPSVGSVVLKSGQFALSILDHLLKFVIIYIFIMAIIYCHTGGYAKDDADYWTDPERIKYIYDHM